MSYRIVQSYYKDLTKASDESIVDQIWRLILSVYFTAEEDFMLEIPSRPAPATSKQSNGSTLAYIHHDKRKALCRIENRRVEYEGQSAVWTEAKKQLTGDLLLEREATKQTEEDIYGVVTVGCYSRFYILRSGRDTLESYPGTDDNCFEFKKDEEAIMDILFEIKATVSHPPSPA